MFMKTKYLIFFPCLFLGTIITLSSSSWFSAWIGLEINLMSMAPILINKMTINSIESSIKYFIFQALASTILIFFIFFSSFHSLLWLSTSIPSIITSTLLLKAGIAPFHFWFPQVMMGSDWTRCLLILTWQKIAPLCLLSYNLNTIMFVALISSALIGSLGGINQINMKILMTYSSILHSAWMLAIILTSSMFWVSYMIIYTFMSISVILPLINLNINSLDTILSLKKFPFTNIFIINFLSMAGMPPLLGFALKLMSLMVFMNSGMSLLIIIGLILSSLTAFYFYLRMVYSALFNTKWQLSNLFVPLNWISHISVYTLVSLIGNMMFSIFILTT